MANLETRRRHVLRIATGLIGVTVLGLGVGAVETAYASLGDAGVRQSAAGNNVGVAVDMSGAAGIAPGERRPVRYTITGGTDAGVPLSMRSSLSVDAGHWSCDADWFEFTPDGAGPGTHAGSVLMRNVDANQDACKGSTVTLMLTLSRAQES
jgi:hypothetical protein